VTDPYQDLHTDCRAFRWDRPCAPHKREGVTCPGCPHYDPVRSRVLVVKLAAIGDVLRTTALLPAIHAQWPGAHVTWLTQPAGRALFDGNALVDEVLDYGDARTAARLAAEEFDVVLCPDADPEAATLAAAARGGERRGFVLDRSGRVEPLGEGAVHWFRMGVHDGRKKANERTYQALVAEVLGLDPAAVREPILEPSAEDTKQVQTFRAYLGFEGRMIGLNTGAGGRWEYKQWTLEHQVRLIELATDAGCGVLLLGGPTERGRHDALLAAAGGRAVYDGGTDNSFSRFAALVDLCDVVVTGDTFALHVAGARKKPTIALFGPTSSAEIELYGRGEKIVPEGLDCLCCYLPRCDRSPHCQALIGPERVWRAVSDWL
jgi:ADP-heptose:LPS heptosyltransferase